MIQFLFNFSEIWWGIWLLENHEVKGRQEGKKEARRAKEWKKMIENEGFGMW